MLATPKLGVRPLLTPALKCPIKNWHPIIGEPTVADAILDRLLHHSYKIELKGESIRKTKK
jgi:DNA replication protein DnaC